MNLSPIALLKLGWKYISKRIPDANALMNKAMEIYQHEKSPQAVIAMLDHYAECKGRGDKAQNDKIWNSFKNKAPHEIIPHGQKILKESGKIDMVLDIIGGKDSNPE